MSQTAFSIDNIRNDAPRQRELMYLINARGSATLRQLHAAIPDAPRTVHGLRTLLNRMARRGLLRRRRSGRHSELIYLPAQVTPQICARAFQQLVEEHFGGSYSTAIERLSELRDAESRNVPPSRMSSCADAAAPSWESRS
jgi:predicted transcriptional regulator